MASSALDREQIASLKLDDSAFTVISMKKAGSGSKPFKTWMKKLNFEEEEGPNTSTQFWRDQYEVWKDFDLCNPKLLAAADLLETLQMRLTYHLQDQHLVEVLSDNGVLFGPFEKGVLSLSYQSLIWYHYRLPKDEEHGLKTAWCDYSMAYAEKAYVQDIQSRGFSLGPGGIDAAMGELRMEMVLYLTTLKTASARNDSAHVFSVSFKQKIQPTFHGAASGPKVRVLLDQPIETMTPPMKKKLLTMLDNLSHLDKLPGGLNVLELAFRMQLFLLKHVLDNWSSMQGGVDVGSQPFQPPPNLE